MTACVLVLLTTLLAGCSAATPEQLRTASIPIRASQPAPSGFTVSPDVAAGNCNGGRGSRLAPPGSKLGVVASATIGTNSTLVGFSKIYPGNSSAVVDSFTRNCRINRTWGVNGSAKVRISPNAVPGRRPGSAVANGLWINAIAARNGGGAIVVGTYLKRWVVGALRQSGRLDSTFGANGWRVLPYHGELSAVVQEPSGRIIVGGDNGGGGCCTRNHAAALSSRGRLERGFGTNGRATLPTGEDSGVGKLELEPNGDILGSVPYGNMGCWGVGLAELTQSGHPVPGFATRLASFWKQLHVGTFVGDVYVDGGGFTLVGTGQTPCVDGQKVSAKSAHGVLARFNTDGTAAAPTVRFRSRLYGDVEAFRHGNESLVVMSPYATQVTDERIELLGRDGSLDRSFGRKGLVKIRNPWPKAGRDLVTTVLAIEANPATLVLEATLEGHRQVRLIRVHV